MPARTTATTPNDKHKENSRYAAHCLTMVAAATDQETRTIQHEMVAEWLNLAEAALHPEAKGLKDWHEPWREQLRTKS